MSNLRGPWQEKRLLLMRVRLLLRELDRLFYIAPYGPRPWIKRHMEQELIYSLGDCENDAATNVSRSRENKVFDR